MANILDSGIKLVRNVGRYNFGASSLGEIIDLFVLVRLEAIQRYESGQVIFLADSTIEENIAFGVPKDKIDPKRVSGKPHNRRRLPKAMRSGPSNIKPSWASAASSALAAIKTS